MIDPLRGWLSQKIGISAEAQPRKKHPSCTTTCSSHLPSFAMKTGDNIPRSERFAFEQIPPSSRRLILVLSIKSISLSMPFSTQTERGRSQLWKFRALCIPGEGHGKLLASYFNPLPQPAQYFHSTPELLYDPDAPLHPDYTHS